MTENGNDRIATPGDRRPLRFCMVTTFYPPLNFGGDGIFVERLCHALAERGHEVTVVHCADSYRLGGGQKHAAAPVEPPRVTVHTLESRAGALSPLITHQFAVPGLKSKALHAILDDGNFDVIHFHNISLVGGPGVLAYGRAIKLYTAHEYWLVCPLSTLWQMGERPCDSKTCVRCTLNARKPPQWWRYTGTLERKLDHLDVLLAPSRFAIAKHAEMGLRADFTLLPNFLPGEGADSPGPERTAGRPFYLFAGRLEQTKGVDVLINAFRDFDAADLLIVGSGPCEGALREQAAGLAHVRFTGRVSYRELRGFYHDAIATLVPSVWYEPFGLIVIESLAQGTPVVVNNAGALPELVEQSGGGIVYDSPAGLLGALKRLFENQPLARTLGERGRDAYRQFWTEERHLQRYFEIIDEQMERRAFTAGSPGRRRP